MSRKPHDVAGNIVELANDANSRVLLRDLDLHRVKRYIWQACVDKLVNVLENRS